MPEPTVEIQIINPVRVELKVTGITNQSSLDAIRYNIQDLVTQVLATEKANELQSVEKGVEYARRATIEVIIK